MLTPVKLASGNRTSVHAPDVTAVALLAVAFLPALSSTVTYSLRAIVLRRRGPALPGACCTPALAEMLSNW